MLVFSTRIPLKDDVTQEKCIQLFIDWITKSPHYNIYELSYDIASHEDYEYEKDNLKVSFQYHKDTNLDLLACRLENREPTAEWFSDCILVNENEKKDLIVQINCNRINYNASLPFVNKPYIIRNIMMDKLCRDDAGIPVVDVPLIVENGYYETCVNIMRGLHSASMPSVYISCDYWNQTVIKPIFLAQQLSGIAHVFVEGNHDTALKLREDTNENNVHNGYIGIYFPGTDMVQRFSLSYYNDYKELTKEIISSVWNAIIYRIDPTSYNWNQITALKSKKGMDEWRDISEQRKKQLSDYLESFDCENKDLKGQVEELSRQVYSLTAQLDLLRSANDSSDANSKFYKVGNEPELYSGERVDLLYSILSQVQSRFERDSHAYLLIESLIQANPKSGECSKITNAIREVFNDGGQMTKAKKSKLKEAGFQISEDGAHYKIVLHDPRYMFTVSKTPSDYREGRNLVSDICKKIDVEKKI